jgi:hypothetical protein
MNKFYIPPRWNIEEFERLTYTEAPFHDEHQIKDYLAVGHKRDSLNIYKYLEPNPMPSCVHEYVFPFFSELNNLVSAINLFRPGSYLPYHSDSYTRYKELFKITTQTIVRSVIMLEDWKPGQIILIDKESYSNWKSGDCFSWNDDTKHSFYNMSLVDRYALQITGTR